MSSRGNTGGMPGARAARRTERRREGRHRAVVNDARLHGSTGRAPLFEVRDCRRAGAATRAGDALGGARGVGGAAVPAGGRAVDRDARLSEERRNGEIKTEKTF